MQWRSFLTAVLIVVSASRLVTAADLQSLVKQLESGAVDAQVSAAQSLGEMGPRAAAAVPALVKALGHDDLSLDRKSVV